MEIPLLDRNVKPSTSPLFQRQLRLADAKQVEAKAARIKDWVTNKLRELEDQNQHLKVQNIHCNEQMELLRKRLEQLQVMGSSTTSQAAKTGGRQSIAEVSLILYHNFSNFSDTSSQIERFFAITIDH